MKQSSGVNTKNMLKFILCSAFGILMFLVPIPQGDSFTTLLDFLKTGLKNLLGGSLNYILLVLSPEMIRKGKFAACWTIPIHHVILQIPGTRGILM